MKGHMQKLPDALQFPPSPITRMWSYARFGEASEIIDSWIKGKLIPWKGNASVSKWVFSTQGTSTFEVKKIDQIEYRARCDVMAYTFTNSIKSENIGI